MRRKYRVVVADDYRFSRAFFEMMVRSSTRYVLAASFVSARNTVDYCMNNAVDLVIMDIMMRTGIDGLTAARQIKEKRPDVKIILVTSAAEEEWKKRAQEIGVESFWYKEYSEESLIDVMNLTMEGENYYPRQPLDISFGDVKRVELTKRDLDVLRELTIGDTAEEIAEKLHISVNTVRTHIQHLLNKTGFKNRLELVANAVSLNIVVSDELRTGQEEP